MWRGELPDGWDEDIPSFPADAKGIATREASGKVLNAIAPALAVADRRLGGPVALHQDPCSTSTAPASFEPGSYGGRNLHFGVREHAMGAIANGMALSRPAPLHRHLPDLQRLHAPADPAGGADGGCR